MYFYVFRNISMCIFYARVCLHVAHTHIHVCIQFYLCGLRATSVAEEAAWDLGVSLPKVRTNVAPPDRG